ncbi:MAG: ABC transporter permease [Desulfobacterales bacterium]|nr:ABC transporter permease [Desulfobacterales bacterium]
MMLLEPVRDAFRALRVNIMRSVLTTLGIIIGVGAVIVMVAVGAGAQAQVAEIINSMGADLLYVFPGSTTSRVRLGAGSLPTLSEEDAEAIQKEILEVQVVAPYLRGRGQIISGNQNWSTSIIGVTPDYFEAREWGLENGKSIAAEEFRGNSKVVLRRQHRRPEPLSRPGPFRFDRPRQSSAFQGRRRAAGQGILHGRMGPGRPGPHPDGPRPQKSTGRTGAERPAGQRDRREGQIAGARLERRERDPRAAAPAAPPAPEPGKRFLDPQPGRGAGDPGRIVADHVAAAGGGGIGVAHGRRHRHHEHHDRLGHRAHPRNRPADGRRGPQTRHPHAVSDGGGGALHDRGPHRHSARRRGVDGLHRLRGLAGHPPAERHRASPSRCRRRWGFSSGSTLRAKRRGWTRSTRCGRE